MRVLRLLLVALACTPLAGCVGLVAASAAGVGIVQYQRNESSRDFDQDLEETWLATLEAMDRLGYGPPLLADRLPLEGIAEYEDAADRVRLRLETLSTGGTRLSVRVGQFDSKNHRRKALVVLEEVSAILGCDEELRAWTEKVKELRAGEPEAGPDGR